ncbi:porin [Solimicrobium silvestre]|uniref:Gram-negative porin n=1 Tax=Solimicrobium silvestre TaxID=2099400 RepID=A0A2S9GVL2_9BURK|nr:porin [Solimicrobium silvestre]PRC91767.1 Gram-negative porin [Solimicrobium silvestre]
MKKSLFMLAALGAPEFAEAQSNVTIYGIADMSINHFSGSNGGLQENNSVTRLDSNAGNNFAGSRLGFKGREDLGGGLSADFKLEMGIQMDTGRSEQGGRLFGRAANIGLNTGYGSLHLGRQDTPAFDLLNSSDPMGVGLAGTTANIHIGNKSAFPVGQPGAAPQQGWIGIGAIRANNSIRYDTPNFNGFSASVLYGMGEVASSSNGNLGIVGLNYKSQAMTIGYVHIDDNSAGVVTAQTADFKQKSDALAFTYDFKIAKLYTLAATKKADSAGIEDKANYYLLGMNAPITSRDQIMLSWNRSAGRNSNANSADQFSIGYSHALSKRTILYTSFSKILNKGNASFGIDGYDGHDGANFDYSRLFNAGILHSF